jgi:hypothetical protein
MALPAGARQLVTTQIMRIDRNGRPLPYTVSHHDDGQKPVATGQSPFGGFRLYAPPLTVAAKVSPTGASRNISLLLFATAAR